MNAASNISRAERPQAAITLPVEGMTCAACQVNVQRALTAAPGVTKAAVNLMLNEATVHYDPAATDPAKLVAAINETGYVSHLPSTGSAVAQDDAREQTLAREYTELRLKAAVSLVLGAIAMLMSMPLMGAHVTQHAGDPLIAWMMRVVDPPLRRGRAVAVRDRAHQADGFPALRHRVRDDVGRPPLLRSRLAGAAPPDGEHEHADRHRHRRGVPVFGDRALRAATCSPEKVPEPTCITKR